MGLCEMRDLAKLFQSRRLEVKTKLDGSAVLESNDAASAIPFYEEINTSDLAFHWKSFAVQHACGEIFRRDGDAITEGLVDAYRQLESDDSRVAKSADDLGRQVFLVVRTACSQAKMCKAATKLVSQLK